MKILFIISFTTLLFLSAPPSGLAQPVAPADPAAQIRAVYESVGSEADCIDGVARSLRASMGLLEEAEAQHRNSGADRALRDAATQTMEAIWVRVREVAARVDACRRDHLGAERITYDAEGNPIVIVDPPDDETADRMGAEGNSLETVDSGSRVAGQVWVIRGEHVDGAGTLDTSRVRRGVHALGQPLEACFRSFTARTGADAAQASISFGITSSGRVTGVELDELRPADRRFQQCVQRGFQRLPRFPRFAGQTMTWSYRLRFGATPAP